MSAPTNSPKKLPLLAAAAAVCLCLLLIPSLGRQPAPAGTASPQASAALPVESTAVPTDSPAPEVTPTPEPVPAFDFSQSAPASAAVEMDYFADALFIGDSRTDGLRLYSGVKGADFYCYNGLTVFETFTRSFIDVNGTTCTVVEALETGPQYGKIYISLGVNELGYFDDAAFEETFSNLLVQVKALQPNAVVYLENLAPVNPDKCKAHSQPYYITNERVADYNAIYPRLAETQQVVLLDVAGALSDENGILPADASSDGVHFTKAWYQKWLGYLMEHTVTAEEYAAGQTA